MSAPLHFRLAVPAEKGALEDLQRLASLISEEDREWLQANPAAIELPLVQIQSKRVIVAERGEATLGFAVVLPRPDSDADLDGMFVNPASWRQGSVEH